MLVIHNPPLSLPHSECSCNPLGLPPEPPSQDAGGRIPPQPPSWGPHIGIPVPASPGKSPWIRACHTLGAWVASCPTTAAWGSYWLSPGASNSASQGYCRWTPSSPGQCVLTPYPGIVTLAAPLHHGMSPPNSRCPSGAPHGATLQLRCKHLSAYPFSLYTS